MGSSLSEHGQDLLFDSVVQDNFLTWWVFLISFYGASFSLNMDRIKLQFVFWSLQYYMFWDSTNLFLLLKDRFIQQEDALDISCFLYNFDLETFFVRFDIFPLYNYINGYRLFPICVPHFIMNFSEPYIICRKPRISHEVQIYLQSLLNFFK